MLQKIYISNKQCYFELSIDQRILKKCIMVSTKILSSTIFRLKKIYINVSRASNQLLE